MASRELHETLVGTVEKRMGVVLMMFKMYEGVSNLQEHLASLDIIPLGFPFVDENIQVD